MNMRTENKSEQNSVESNGPLAQFDALLLEYVNAMFDCGEQPTEATWDEYDPLLLDVKEAEEKLRAWVEKNCIVRQSVESDGLFRFGDYVIIEQKRHGAENEMYVHKVVGTLNSNSYVDVPVQCPATETAHKEVVPVVACVCCGVCEREIRRYRASDISLKRTIR